MMPSDCPAELLRDMLFFQQLIQCRDDLWSIPVNGGIDAVVNFPIGSDHKGGWKGDDLPFAGSFSLRVEQDWIVDSNLLHKVSDTLSRFGIVNRDQFKLFTLHFFTQTIQGGDFLNTGMAPAGPEVDNGNLAFEVVPMNTPAMYILE